MPVSTSANTTLTATTMPLSPMPDELKPHFANVQAHYDLSDDFFRAVPRSHSDPQLRLLRARRHDAAEAQIAKIDPAPGNSDCSRA